MQEQEQIQPPEPAKEPLVVKKEKTKSKHRDEVEEIVNALAAAHKTTRIAKDEEPKQKEVQATEQVLITNEQTPAVSIQESMSARGAALNVVTSLPKLVNKSQQFEEILVSEVLIPVTNEFVPTELNQTDTTLSVLEVTEELVVPVVVGAERSISQLPKPDYEILAEALPFIVFEPKVTAPETSELVEPAVETLSIVEQLTGYIKTLEPEKATESEAILAVVMQNIEVLYDIETSEKEKESAQQGLEIICSRMLSCMGVEPTPEVVNNLLLALKKEYLEQFEVAEAISYEEGTHERKPDLRQIFHDLPDITHHLSVLIGKFTLQLAA